MKLQLSVPFGLLLRIDSIRNQLVEHTPGGEEIIRVGLGILGLGFMGIGLIGAIIIYWRFNAFDLSRVPLHAFVVGLSAYTIYLTMNWNRREI